MVGFSIGEVEKIAGIKPHILRYWETVVPFVSPQKNDSGRRVYTARHMDFIFRIRYLMEKKDYSLHAAGIQLCKELNIQNPYIAEISHIRQKLLHVYRRVQDSKNP